MRSRPFAALLALVTALPLVALVVLAAPPAVAAHGTGAPISEPWELADPFVLRDDTTGHYFAYGTNDRHNLPIFRSADLHDWERVDPPDQPPFGDHRLTMPTWALPRDQGGELWAPAALRRGGSYILFMAVRHRTLRDRAGQPLFCITRAEAHSPEGVFTPTDGDEPFLCQPELNGSIDPSVLIDDGDVPYLIWKSEGHLGGEPTRVWVQQLSPDGRTLLGERTDVLHADQPWEEPLIENPHMEKVDGRYFLFYSGNDYRSSHYAVGYAACAGVRGPCSKPLNRPFLTSDGSMEGPGGSELFATPDGRQWMIFHAWAPGQVGRTPTSDPAGPGRQARLLELRFDPTDGRPQLGDGAGTWFPSRRTVRLAGADRFDTAAALSRVTTRAPSPVLYVATGEQFPDALAGGPAAGREGGAVLTVGRFHLAEATQAEIRRMQPGHIVLMGGSSAISADVEAQLRALQAEHGGGLHRESGTDRFDTAARVSANTWRQTDAGANVARVAYVATGLAYPDALAAGAAGARHDGPVLLTLPEVLPDATARELQRLTSRGLERVVVVGGRSAVSDAVAATIAQRYGVRVDRVAGGDRFDTAAQVARTQFPPPVGAMIVATGEGFADAVAAGAFGAPIVLVPRDGPVPPSTAGAIDSVRPLGITIVGGSGAVAASVEEELG
jgi:putative cell wall-binding protein/GH43 family beta-xylosidase